MKNRETVRPEGRIKEKSRSQMRREDIMNREEGKRTRVKLPKPKPEPVLGTICLYCGEVFPSGTESAIRCPKCATPF